MNLQNSLSGLFDEIEQALGDKAKAHFLMVPYTDITSYHFGFGLWVRNNILAKRPEVVQLFGDYDIFEFDDISSLITDLFYLHMKEKYCQNQ